MPKSWAPAHPMLLTLRSSSKSRRLWELSAWAMSWTPASETAFLFKPRTSRESLRNPLIVVAICRAPSSPTRLSKRATSNSVRAGSSSTTWARQATPGSEILLRFKSKTKAFSRKAERRDLDNSRNPASPISFTLRSSFNLARPLKEVSSFANLSHPLCPSPAPANSSSRLCKRRNAPMPWANWQAPCSPIDVKLTSTSNSFKPSKALSDFASD
mmetsp:Transcript_68230/g.149947  ORF Transcript_68230/g.149947 Transcript_68230/m.149947 type:complete len:214 (+) Transcript_68230:657-1298(+)